MDEGQEGRGGNFDDLFDDLDQFFQPGERSEQEPAEPAAPDRAPERDAKGTGRSRPISEEILDTSWMPDLADADVVADRTGPDVEAAVDEPAPNTGESSLSISEPEPRVVVPSEESSTPPARVGAGLPSDEGQEWARLRGALDDGGETEDATIHVPGGSPSTAGDPLFDFLSDDPGPAPGASWSEDRPSGDHEEPTELTLDDLKKAPPEYRDLPGAEIGAPAEPSGQPSGEPEVLDELFGEEPDIADVELAADQLAREFAPDEFAEADAEADQLPEEDEEEDLAVSTAPPPRRTVQVREPESLSGPTWEEPTSRVVSNESQGPRTSEGRNLPAAILTAALLAAGAILFVFIRPWLFTIFAGGGVLLGQYELYVTMQHRGFRPAWLLGLLVGGMVVAAAYFEGERALLAFIGMGVVASFLWYMASGPKAREGAVRDMGATLFGILYVPFLAAYYVLILTKIPSGRTLMLAVLGATFVYDAVAYVVGSLYGSRAIAPMISPKKSVEGLIGATLCTIVFSALVIAYIEPFSWTQGLALGAVISVFAPLGDLAESMLKRDLGVKDMGSVLPGHGGILDRIDSALFVGIAAFYFLRLILA